MALYHYQTAQESAEALAERVRKSPHHTAEVRNQEVDIDGRVIGTQWEVRITGSHWSDRGGQVFWFQPIKGRAYLSSGYLDKYGNHKKSIKVGKYDYRKLNLWLAVCVDVYREM